MFSGQRSVRLHEAHPRRPASRGKKESRGRGRAAGCRMLIPLYLTHANQTSVSVIQVETYKVHASTPETPAKTKSFGKNPQAPLLTILEEIAGRGPGGGGGGGGVSAPPKGSAGQPSAPSRQRGSRGLRVGACNVSKAPPSSDSGLAGFFRVKRHQTDVTVCLLSHHHFFFFFFC